MALQATIAVCNICLFTKILLD